MSRAHRRLWWMGTPIRGGLVLLIRGYQLTLGGALGGRCRFTPSCSEYGLRAVRELGALRGGALLVWRVLRCWPAFPGGVDPVPEASQRYDGVIQAAGASRWEAQA